VTRVSRWLVLLLAVSFLSVAQENGAPKEGHGEAAHEEKSEPDMTGWKWANFALLAAALGFLVAKSAGPYFVTRSLEIRKGIEDAGKMRAEAEANAAAIEKRLANLGVEVESMRKSAREEAEREGARIRQETGQELAKVQSNASHEIASALKAAQQDLKIYAGQLSIDLARQKVRDQMTAADQDGLVRNFVSDLPSRIGEGASQ
jgi:F0F1-type ATP synthase membrane subunit b/b'